jgi:hypothetical protein
MSGWKGNPSLDAEPSQAPIGQGSATSLETAENAQDENWRAMATHAVGSLLGIPFLAVNTIHGAWAEIWQIFSLKGKPPA